MRRRFLNKMYNFDNVIEHEKILTFEDVIKYTKHSLLLNKYNLEKV